MQAILTRYLKPTRNKGARMSARASARTIVVAYDHTMELTHNHATVARQLWAGLNWQSVGPLVGGCLPNGSDWAWVMEHPASRFS